MTSYPKPPSAEQRQELPGRFQAMDPVPDHGEDSGKGRGRLDGMTAIFTGGDSGIGRAVALAHAREGADVAIVHPNEGDDARSPAEEVEASGRECLWNPADLSQPEECRRAIDETAAKFGKIDVLVNNAAP